MNRLALVSALGWAVGTSGAEKQLPPALLEWLILERDFLPLPVADPGAKK